MDVRFCEGQEPPAERQRCELGVLVIVVLARSSEARVRRILFPLDKRLTWMFPLDKRLTWMSATRTLRKPYWNLPSQDHGLQEAAIKG
jgi:hypothetical protein